MAFNYKQYQESLAVQQARAEAEASKIYNQSQAVLDSKNAWEHHLAHKVPDWTGGTYADDVSKYWDKLQNREKFTYDLNGDMLYQQYKDQYMNLGKLAMQDTMGQAAAMTGGYGNSYAATAGNQAYQGYLQQLNNVVPELYQMALNQYNQEGQDMKDNLAMAQALQDSEYGKYRDTVSDWYADEQRLSDRYYNESNMDWTKFVDNRAFFTDAYNNERTWDYGQYSDAYDRAFNSYQQQVSEQQYAQQLALQQAQLQLQKDEFEYSKTADASKVNVGTGGDDVYTMTPKELRETKTELENELSGAKNRSEALHIAYKYLGELDESYVWGLVDRMFPEIDGQKIKEEINQKLNPFHRFAR